MNKRHESPEMNRLATSQDVNALVGRVGELFTAALVKKGLIEVGEELPAVTEAPLHAPTLRRMSRFNLWPEGAIQYSPTHFGEYGQVEDPALVTVAFKADLKNARGSERNDSFLLSPSFMNPIEEVTAAESYRGGGDFAPFDHELSPEEIALAANPELKRMIDAEAAARQEMDTAMGFNPQEMQLGDVIQLRNLAQASIKPHTIHLP